MNPKSAPDAPPANLLARCLDTIPQAATQKINVPRPSPDAGSRKRLAWLTVAAAIPVVTVLAVLPVKHRMNMSRTPPRSAQTSPQPNHAVSGESGVVPYVRIEGWERTAGKGKINPPEHRLTIYDARRGKCEWTTDSTYREINPDSPLALLLARHGKTYTSHYRSYKKCLVKEGVVSLKSGLDGYAWAYNYRFIGRTTGYGLTPKELPSDTTEWEGKAVLRYHYRSLTLAEWQARWRSPRSVALRKKLGVSESISASDLQTLKGIPGSRTEVYVDPATGRVVGSRAWAYFRSDPEGLLMEEKSYRYEPLPDEDRFFDVDRIKRGAVIKPNRSNYFP